jgi:DNA-binding transcriptional LysR family regulator
MATGIPADYSGLLAPQDLRDVPLIGLSAADPAQHRLEAALRQAGMQPRMVIETPYSATQCALVLAGAGLAVTNPLVARAFTAQGICCRPFDAPTVTFRALLAFRPRQAQSLAVQEFVALCRRLLTD